MHEMYVVAWKSKTTGRTGRGKAVMSQEEAERVAAELNEQYPSFEHFALELGNTEFPDTTAGVVEDEPRSESKPQDAMS